MTSEELEKAIEISLKGQEELREQMNRTQAQVEKTDRQMEKTQAQVERTQAQVERTEISLEETKNIVKMQAEMNAEFREIVFKHIENEREIFAKFQRDMREMREKEEEVQREFRREMRDLRYDQSHLWEWHDKMRKDLDEMSVMMKNLLSLKSRNGNSGNE